jgi:hypothetical protein
MTESDKHRISISGALDLPKGCSRGEALARLAIAIRRMSDGETIPEWTGKIEVVEG